MTFLKAIPCLLWGLLKGALVGGLFGIAGCLLGATGFFLLSFIGLPLYGWITGPRYFSIEEPWKISTVFSGVVLAAIGFVWGAVTGFRNMALMVDL